MKKYLLFSLAMMFLPQATVLHGDYNTVITELNRFKQFGLRATPADYGNYCVNKEGLLKAQSENGDQNFKQIKKFYEDKEKQYIKKQFEKTKAADFSSTSYRLHKLKAIIPSLIGTVAGFFVLGNESDWLYRQYRFNYPTYYDNRDYSLAILGIGVLTFVSGSIFANNMYKVYNAEPRTEELKNNWRVINELSSKDEKLD